MKTISELIDKTNISIYEAQSLTRCLHIILECGLINNENCSYLLPLAKILEKKFQALKANFDILEEKIYCQILLKK